ncbi:MAG: hypothetical protein ACP5D2_01505 [Candidatus Nanoarchaeia archaeon]
MEYKPYQPLYKPRNPDEIIDIDFLPIEDRNVRISLRRPVSEAAFQQRRREAMRKKLM